MGWGRGDLVRVAGVSSSVVTQWLGKGSKPIHRIGQVRAAVRLERATGYSAIWLADGDPPKRAPGAPLPLVGVAREPAPAWALTASAADQDAARTVAAMGRLLAAAPPAHLEGLARLLDGWAREGGPAHYEAALVAMLDVPPEKRHAHGR